jgi:hypothetical protein
MAQQSIVGRGHLIIEASRSHSDTPQSVGALGRGIGPTQGPVPDNTIKKQASMSTGGFRTCEPSKRAAADPRHRPRGHWDRQKDNNTQLILSFNLEVRLAKSVLYRAFHNVLRDYKHL